MKQAIGQPLGGLGTLEGDLGDGVREAGQVFQGQLGQAHRDRVDFTGDKAPWDWNRRSDHAVEGQLNVGGPYCFGGGFGLQASAQGPVGKHLN